MHKVSNALNSPTTHDRRGLQHQLLISFSGASRGCCVGTSASVWAAGDGLVVSTSGPGIFLQGLAVHGASGAELPGGAALDRAVVAAAFQYAERTGTPLCAFLGDTCATLRMTTELEARSHSIILCDMHLKHVGCWAWRDGSSRTTMPSSFRLRCSDSGG